MYCCVKMKIQHLKLVDCTKGNTLEKNTVSDVYVRKERFKIRDWCVTGSVGRLYTNKLDNRDERDKSLGRHKLPNLTY